MTTTISPSISPFLVPPKETTSAPTSVVSAARETPEARRCVAEPSAVDVAGPCPRPWACSARAVSSSAEYTVPSSVLWVTLTTLGWLWWGSPQPCACRSTSSGVSRASVVGTVSSLSPASFSGAPHSSTWMWAFSVQITASHRRVSACRETTLAPVPLKTGYACAVGPNCSRTTARNRSVCTSSPYAGWCPPSAAARAAMTSGCTEAWLSLPNPRRSTSCSRGPVGGIRVSSVTGPILAHAPPASRAGR